MFSVILLTLFFIVYAVVHSLLASLRFKNWVRRTTGPQSDRWYRLAYNVFATLTFLPVFPMLALLPDQMLYVVSPPWRWLMMVLQFFAMIAFVRAFFQTDVLHFLGISQLFTSDAQENKPLVIEGFYCWVRHPLYTFSLIVLWLIPDMSQNMLTFTLLTTLYFLVGSIFEERRMLHEFGEAYAAYQRQVPRLIPMPWRCFVHNSVARRPADGSEQGTGSKDE